MQSPILALVSKAAVLTLVALLPVPAGAQSRAAVHTLTVVVPRFVRLVVDSSAGEGDSLPVIRVITNDRTIRALTANGLPPELVPLAVAAGGRLQHAKGGDRETWMDDPEPLVRFTQVAP